LRRTVRKSRLINYSIRRYELDICVREPPRAWLPCFRRVARKSLFDWQKKKPVERRENATRCSETFDWTRPRLHNDGLATDGQVRVRGHTNHEARDVRYVSGIDRNATERGRRRIFFLTPSGHSKIHFATCNLRARRPARYRRRRTVSVCCSNDFSARPARRVWILYEVNIYTSIHMCVCVLPDNTAQFIWEWNVRIPRRRRRRRSRRLPTSPGDEKIIRYSSRGYVSFTALRGDDFTQSVFLPTLSFARAKPINNKRPPNIGKRPTVTRETRLPTIFTELSVIRRGRFAGTLMSNRWFHEICPWNVVSRHAIARVFCIARVGSLDIIRVVRSRSANNE